MNKLGVLQPVYNVQDFVENSIESILKQSFEDFIYAIVDDGSTDNTLDVIREFEKKDNRIVVIEKKHDGLANSLNRGAQYLCGKCNYIARMDGDDISKYDRFEKQINFMENNNLAFCSTWAEIYNKQGDLIEKFSPKFKTKFDLKEAMLKMNFIIHGSVMFRTSIFSDAGFFYRNGYVEDYWLWMEIMNKFDAAILEDYLYELRARSGSHTDIYANKIYNEAKMCREYWSKVWNIEIPEFDYDYLESF